MGSTVIDSTEFMITSPRDETVGAFYAWENKKLEHLPRNIGDLLPNLLNLHAAKCSIKQISRENFKNLSKLRRLNLDGNQIERIDDDTFEFIPAVERIFLCEYLI